MTITEAYLNFIAAGDAYALRLLQAGGSPEHVKENIIRDLAYVYSVSRVQWLQRARQEQLYPSWVPE